MGHRMEVYLAQRTLNKFDITKSFGIDARLWDMKKSDKASVEIDSEFGHFTYDA